MFKYLDRGSTKNMAMSSSLTSSSQKLMQEISDQFLICKICYETYKRPKTLICLHIFCTDCLEKQYDAEIERSYRYMLYARTITCPVCRKKTDLSAGGIRKLPDNFLVSNLIEIINRRRGVGRGQFCEICKTTGYHSSKEAVSKCLECSKTLCQNCVELHRRTKVTRGHNMVDIQTEKSIACKVHLDEVVRFYCEPCEMCICILCTFQEHKGHDVQSFNEGVVKYQHSLDTLVSACRDKMGCVKDQLDMIRNCESEIRKAEDTIRETTIESISAIRQNEKQLVEQLYNFYGVETLQYLKEKNVLQDILDNLTSSCNLTEIILKDRSIELLLLRKELQEKLEVLLQGSMHTPPKNVAKHVTVEPGYVALGQIIVDGKSTDGCKALRILQNSCDADVQTDIAMQEELEVIGRKTQKSSHAVMCDSGTVCYNEGELTRSKGFFSKQTDDRCVNTCPPDLADTLTMTENARIDKHSVQTDCIPVVEKETATEAMQLFSQWTNTPTVNSMDRSTLTTMTETHDHQTETTGLIDYISTISGPELPHSMNTGTLTDPPSLRTKFTNTLPRQMSDKKTSTIRNLTMEKCIATEKTHMLDFGITAKMLGCDKGVGTKAIVLYDACEGDNTVLPQTRETATDTIWQGVRRVRHKATNMDDLLFFKKNQATETEITIPPPGEATGFVSENQNSKLYNEIFAEQNIFGVELSDQMASPTKRKLPPVQAGSKRLCTQGGLDFSSEIEMQTCQTQTDISLPETDKFFMEYGNRPSLVNMGTNTDQRNTNIVDKGTSMGSCVRVTDINSGAVVTRRLERALNFRSLSFDEATPVRTREKGTSTYVQTVEKATYMIQPVILSTGTNTSMVLTSDKKTDTEIETKDSWTSPHTPKVQEHSNYHPLVNYESKATMKFNLSQPPLKQEHVQDYDNGANFKVGSRLGECTGHFRTVNTSNQKDLVETGTDPIPASSQDASTATVVIDTKENGTKSESLPTKSTATMTFILTADASVLKRPHTLTRSTSMKKIKMVESETQMKTITSADKAAMTEKAITGPRTRHANTGTICITLADATTETPMTKVVDRNCSPVRVQTRERHTSPYRTQTICKGIGANIKTPSAEKSIGTFKVQLKSIGTGTTIVNFKDRQCSPIRNITVEKSTSVDKLQTIETGTATDKTKHVNASTTTKHIVHTKDQSTIPVKFPGHSKAIMAVAETATKESATVPTKLSEKASATDPAQVKDTGTGTAQVQYYDKETYTPRVNIMHKNVATENLTLVDKQTATIDISAAYRGLIAPQVSAPVTVSRGTSTSGIETNGKNNTVNRQTSPIRTFQPMTVEKGTIARPILVHKAVGVTKADLTCPVETFHRPGQSRMRILPKNMPKEEPEPKFQPCMDTIAEGSSDEEPPSPGILRHALKSGNLDNLVRLDENPSRGEMTHREKLWLTAPRLNATQSSGTNCSSPTTRDHCGQSTFSANGSTQTSSILCKVETGTSTPPIEKEDKSSCTEALSVDSKISQCITKLRAVSKRLEGQTTSFNLDDDAAPPIYSKADSMKNYAKTTQATSSPVSSDVSITRGQTNPREGIAPLPNFQNRLTKLAPRYGAEGSCPPYLARRDLHSVDTGASRQMKGSESGNGSGNSSNNGNGNGNARSKARKQRLDMTQLLQHPPGVHEGPGGNMAPGGLHRTPYRPSSMFGPRQGLGILDQATHNLDSPAHRRLRLKMSAIESPEDESPPPLTAADRFSDKENSEGSSNNSSPKQRSERPKLERMLGSQRGSPTSSPKYFRPGMQHQQKPQSPRVTRKPDKDRTSKGRQQYGKPAERRESSSSDQQGVCCGLAGSSKCPHRTMMSPKQPRKNRENTGKLPSKRPSSASSTSSASAEDGNDSPVRRREGNRRKTRKSP